jgi:hypothetical protein
MFVLRGFVAPSGARMMSVSNEAAASTPEVISDVNLEAVATAMDPIPTGWWPSQMMEALFVSLHDSSNLSWGLTITAATVGLRVFLLPLILYQVCFSCVCPNHAQ